MDTNVENQNGGENTGENSGNRSFGDVTEREPVVDEAGDQSSETTQSTGDQNQDENQGGETQGEGDKSTQDENQGEDGQPKLTEKGTKLDPNPESAAHQLLANERKLRNQMEQVLGNPELLAKFMQEQHGIAVPQKTETPAPQETPARVYTADDFKNVEDVAKVVNDLNSGFEQSKKAYETKIQQLEEAVGGLSQNGHRQQVAATMAADVEELRKASELNPKSPDYIEGLEEDIANLYHQLDYDEKTGSYKGQYSLTDVGNRILGAARKARKQGSLTAQTVIKDRQAGQVRTSPKVTTEQDTEKMAPGDSIAAGISKLFG